MRILEMIENWHVKKYRPIKRRSREKEKIKYKKQQRNFLKQSYYLKMIFGLPSRYELDNTF